MLRLKKFDFKLFLLMIFLLFFGAITIASVSPQNLPSHLAYILISILFFFLFSSLDLEILFPLSPFIYLFCLAFLSLPFFLGTVTRGAVRWIPIGGFTIQPSEVIKPLLALVSAWFWSKKEFSFRNFFIFVIFFLPVLMLVFFQPDLGSTLVVLSIFVAMIMFSEIKVREFITLFLVLSLALPLLWFSLKDYQKTRLINFFNPYSDPLGEGYNLIQSKISVGSGMFLGQGLGHGTQSHLAFLPERHTDFIFASLSEEMGFIGSFLVIFLFILLFLRILKIAKSAKGRSELLLSIGLFFYLFFQTIVNIGMNIGILPITGITLPLISYGGSSLLATMTSLGILESIYQKNRDERIIEIK